VRARRRVDDGPGALHDLELVVVPRRRRRSLVGAVADLDRIAAERLGGVSGVEVQLDHLPVALVRVVEVVEGVEEPVLERDLARARWLGHDVGVHGGSVVGREPLRPAFVGAARVERVAGEVEVVLPAAEEVLRRRGDPYEVAPIPGTAERDGRLVEEEVHVGRDVGLAVAALLRLLHELHDRRVPFRERLFVGVVGVRGGDRDECAERDDDDREPRGAARSQTTHGRRTNGSIVVSTLA
jgi:hypothetical protein